MMHYCDVLPQAAPLPVCPARSREIFSFPNTLLETSQTARRSEHASGAITCSETVLQFSFL
ncbi:hypothetical protein Scep_029887 [Stephania cephalantha]|uniref:Uncharacterized protein n=1 Tax=Stephania cephalantha TaxID=152367 RepID=A0AAP0HGD8_9MAGN